MPRGFVHEAFTSDTTSLHVTLAIPTADFAWGHFLAEAVDILKYDHDALRESLPLRFSMRDRALSDTESPLAPLFQAKLDEMMKKIHFSKSGAVFDTKMARHNIQQLDSAREVAAQEAKQPSRRLHQGSVLSRVEGTAPIITIYGRITLDSTPLSRVEGTAVKKIPDGSLVFEHGGRHSVYPSPNPVVETVMAQLEDLLARPGEKKDMFLVGEIPLDDPFTQISVGEALCQFRVVENVGELRPLPAKMGQTDAPQQQGVKVTGGQLPKPASKGARPVAGAGRDPEL